MARLVVLGGLGGFGGSVAAELRRLGFSPRIATRGARVSGAGGAARPDLHVDADDRESIERALEPGDLVVDAAGPFHRRSTALVELACAIGFDIIDLNDDLTYAQAVLGQGRAIAAAGIRVLSSCSSVSAIAARAIAMSGVREPTRFSSFLMPASRQAANPGTARSLLRSVGREVRVLRGGRLVARPGWSEVRRFPMPAPLGTASGHLFESADAVWLPRRWPSLTDAAMFVDANAYGVNALLGLAARYPGLRRALERNAAAAARVARFIGRGGGGLGYEVVDAGGRRARLAFVARERAFLAAVAPAVLSARAILEGRFEGCGLVPPDRHVAEGELLAHLNSAGIFLHRIEF